MKNKRLAVFCILLTLIMLLCACSSRPLPAASGEETPSPLPSATVTQPQESAPNETVSIAELYEKTDISNVFRLNNISTDGYSVEQSYLSDGYVLLLMRDFSEQGYENEIGTQHILNSGKLVLFPLNRPDAAVSLSVDNFEANYALLSGGTVLVVSWDGGFTLYNSELEVISEESTSCGTYIGASKEGDIWFLTEDSSVALYRDGKLTQTDPVEGMVNGSYIGTRSGKAYFTMYNSYYGWTLSSIDLQDLSYSENRTLSDFYDAHNGFLSYSTEDSWYVASYEAPLTVTSFTKPYSNEGVWDMDDRFLIGSNVNYDARSDSFRYDYHAYDLENGGICAEIDGNTFSDYILYILDFDQGVALLEAHDEMMATKGLYIWDLRGLTSAEPAKKYETIDFHVDEKLIEELIQQIYDRYGVTIYYDTEHLKEYSSGYDLLECSDTELIGYTLLRLQECMAEYPEGFFREIKGESMQNVVFCLCGGHDRIDMSTIEDAAATVDKFGDTLRMSIDVHQWLDLRRTFLHENTHMMETRLEEEMPKVSSRHYVEYWYNEMNLPDCPPIQQYIWEQNDEPLKGVYDLDPEHACYIDWYSKCTISEDHARIMENGIYSGSARFFTAPYIDRKSRFLNAMIREAFPCVRNSGEVFWEQRTGIVDLHQEFADFADLG